MKRLLRLSVVFGLAFILHGCAVYPYSPPAYSGYYGYAYPSSVYRPYGSFGWGGRYPPAYSGYYGYTYPSSVYRPYGSFGWSGWHHWGGGYSRGFGGGGHQGWGGGHGRR